MRKQIDMDKLIAFGIPNLKAVKENGTIIGVRGESLSGKNRKYLWAVKKAGIDSIIDLRATDHSRSFKSICEAAGYSYLHFPVDQAHTSDEKIIQNLPLLIETINQGGFYIACAMGLHRTDIALALCWLFNPKAQEPPILHGHHRNGIFRFEDIYRRANSVYRSLTGEDKAAWGWDEDFNRDFNARKKILTRMQSAYIAELNRNIK